MSIGIVGYGHVGKAQKALFKDAIVYDKYLNIGSKKAINDCYVTFVSVPTPTVDGKCDTSIVEEVIDWVKSRYICILSTIPPYTTERLKRKYKKRIVFQPEYIGESVDHPLLDKVGRDFIILGGEREDCNAIIWAYQKVYNSSVKIRTLTSYEAEFVKYMENRAIAFKLGEVQEGYDLAKKLKIDWNVVREAIYHDDPRMSPFWTFVYEEDRGFHSSCIPKDIEAICALAKEYGYRMEITEKLLERNKKWRNKQ